MKNTQQGTQDQHLEKISTAQSILEKTLTAMHGELRTLSTLQADMAGDITDAIMTIRRTRKRENVLKLLDRMVFAIQKDDELWQRYAQISATIKTTLAELKSLRTQKSDYLGLENVADGSHSKWVAKIIKQQKIHKVRRRYEAVFAAGSLDSKTFKNTNYESNLVDDIELF